MMIARTVMPALSSKKTREHHSGDRSTREDKFLARNPRGKRKQRKHEGSGHQNHSCKELERYAAHKSKDYPRRVPMDALGGWFGHIICHLFC